MTDPYDPATPADSDRIGSATVGAQVHIRDMKQVLKDTRDYALPIGMQVYAFAEFGSTLTTAPVGAPPNDLQADAIYTGTIALGRSFNVNRTVFSYTNGIFTFYLRGSPAPQLADGGITLTTPVHLLGNITLDTSSGAQIAANVGWPRKFLNPDVHCQLVKYDGNEISFSFYQYYIPTGDVTGKPIKVFARPDSGSVRGYFLILQRTNELILEP